MVDGTHKVAVPEFLTCKVAVPEFLTCKVAVPEFLVLPAMAYVDLNPIRAKMADTPESSAYTPVAERIATLRRAHSWTPTFSAGRAGGRQHDLQADAAQRGMTDYDPLVIRYLERRLTAAL